MHSLVGAVGTLELFPSEDNSGRSSPHHLLQILAADDVVHSYEVHTFFITLQNQTELEY
jgi:hypothetical protein